MIILRNGNLIGCMLKIMDYMLRTQKKAREGMRQMGGKVLELYSEKTEKRARREMANCIKDIRNGVKSAELKKKYNADTIKLAKAIG